MAHSDASASIPTEGHDTTVVGAEQAARTAAGDWVQSRLDWHHKRLTTRRRYPVVGRERVVLSDFQHKALAMFVRAMGTGIYNLSVKWERADFSYSGAVRIVLYGSLSTWDFNHLTRLVVAAHDACVRVSVEGASNRYLAVSMHHRERDADAIHARHPTIEQAIEAFRA